MENKEMETQEGVIEERKQSQEEEQKADFEEAKSRKRERRSSSPKVEQGKKCKSQDQVGSLRKEDNSNRTLPQNHTVSQSNRQTDKHTDIQSQRNIEEQTHGSTESQKQKGTDIQTQEVHRNGIYLMSYRYTQKIEKISKVKDIVKVDLSDRCDKEARWTLIEKKSIKN
uniref:Uncharacterized protein n=1 Tax=Octopus bimaculoides TaxID=37653 RepID=A0A0L8ID47_OCTBM